MACKGAVPLILEWECLLGCELLKVKDAFKCNVLPMFSNVIYCLPQQGFHCLSQPGNEKFISKFGGEVWSGVTPALGTNSILFSRGDFQGNKIDISFYLLF